MVNSLNYLSIQYIQTDQNIFICLTPDFFQTVSNPDVFINKLMDYQHSELHYYQIDEDKHQSD